MTLSCSVEGGKVAKKKGILVILVAKKAKLEEGKAEKEEKTSHKAEKEEKASGHKDEKPAKEEEKKAGRPAKEEEKTERPAKEEEKKAEKEEKNVEGKEKEHGMEERRKRKEKPKRGKISKEKFVELKTEEIVEAIVHLANEGHSQSEIGMILRDQYGIPKVGKVVGKKIGAIMQQQNLMQKIPEDLMNLIRKSVALREHLARNRKDMSAKHGLMLTVSKIRALERYYKKSGRLPMRWRYSPETAALLAK